MCQSFARRLSVAFGGLGGQLGSLAKFRATEKKLAEKGTKKSRMKHGTTFFEKRICTSCHENHDSTKLRALPDELAPLVDPFARESGSHLRWLLCEL